MQPQRRARPDGRCYGLVKDFPRAVSRRSRASLPGMATIKHRGRKSGKPYETIVSAFRKGDVVAIALGHGKTDWVKNVLAGGEADLQLTRGDVQLVNPRIVPAGSGAEDLPRMARLQAGKVAIFVADIA
jgi:deazaflavin-dependent oxidoreductase (nitroreductase family)